MTPHRPTGWASVDDHVRALVAADPACKACTGLGWVPNPAYDEWGARQEELHREWVAAGRPGGRWLDSDACKAHRDVFPAGEYQLNCACTRPKPGGWLPPKH